MSTILAIDPGTVQSGVLIWDGARVIDSAVVPNADVLALIAGAPVSHCAVEMVASYGMAVGKETFRTVWWAGRFAEAWMRRTGNLPMEVYRLDVKVHLCHTAKAKDTNLWKALTDRFGEPGTKAQPGTLFGVKSHARAALAVAVTAHDQLHAQARAA